MANTKVTGDLIASSTIATGNIADNAVTSDKISGITTAHITEGSNLYYTDARADARVALLVDSAPSTLNTLNELADALGDDPNYAATTAITIGLKAPKASPSFTGTPSFTLNDGVFIKAINGTNNIVSTNVWGYGLYEGGSKLGEISLVRDGSNNQMYIGTTTANQVLRIGSANKVTALTLDGSQNATFAADVTIETGVNLESGVLVIKNATTDSNGLRIFQDSSDASKIYNNYNGTLQLGVSNTTALTLGSSQNATFAGTVTFNDHTTHPDQVSSYFGTGNDASIQHNGGHLFIDNSVGSTYLRNTSTGDILLRNSTGGDIQFDNEFAGNILFNTSNIERMRITSGGLVSLPTTGLNDTRHIILIGTQGAANNAGNLGMWGNEVRLTGNWYYNGAHQKSVTGNGIGVIGIGTGTTDAASYLTFGINGPSATGGPTERMRISSSGNVGIGFAPGHSAVTLLELPANTGDSSLKVGSIETQSYAVNNGWVADNVYYDGNFKLRSAGYASQVYFGISNGGGDISFKRYPTGSAGDVVTGVISLQLLGDGKVYIPGNVGIGTDNPLTTFHVNQSSDAQVLVQGTNKMALHQDAAWNSNILLGCYYDGSNIVYGSTNRGAFKIVGLHDSTTQPQTLSIYGANGASPAGSTVTFNSVGFSQDEDGKVGIGTTGPTEMLHINGGGSGPEVRLEGTWGSHYIRAYNDNWNFLVGGTVQAINIKNNGTVQMGTTNTAAKLNVGGTILVSDNNQSAGMYVRRSLNLSHPGNTGTFTRTFNPVTQFGMAKAGGYVLLEVAGWSQRVNCGYIQFQNAGGSGNITSVVYVQTAVNGNGSISVSVNSAGDNSIDVNFSNWHGNSHAWQAKIITQ